VDREVGWRRHLDRAEDRLALVDRLGPSGLTAAECSVG
jgi:hypothetical protein